MNNYEKKYKEALERAKKNYDAAQDLSNDSKIGVECFKNTLTNIFPELKESEDERIRKDCIKYLDWEYQHCSFNEDKMKIEKCITWLEKQGESDETRAKMFLINKGYPIDTNGIFPTYEEMYNIIKEGLEKQDKQKPIFNADDWYVSKVDGKIHNAKFIKKQGEKKPTDKVEPKFHPGNWVVHNKADFVFKVISVGSNSYEVVNKENHKKTISFDNENNYHLWTIKDAEDGDILISSLYKQPFVYNGNYTCDSLGAYFGLNYQGELSISDNNDNDYNNWTSLTGIQPATEEQCNMLFKKLHDSDYKWDSEKKELWHKYL